MTSDGVALPDAHALFEFAACGLLLTAEDGTIHRVNETFCHWVNRPASSLVGKRRLQDLLTMGGRLFHQTHWAPLLQLQGSVSEVKLDVVHQDGTKLPMMMNAVRRVHQGTTYHELAIFSARDRHRYEQELIHSRQRTESLLDEAQRAQAQLAVAQERLRLALESARLAVWEFDAGTAHFHYGADVALLLGYPAPRQVSRDEYLACIHPEDRGRESTALVQALAADLGDYACSYRLCGVDGLQRQVSASGRVTFDQAHQPARLIGMLHDITELANQRALAEDRALFAEQMVGIVSHDLRNPLAAIQMGAQFLRRGELTLQQQQVLQRVDKASARANRLINDLLDFTRARMGGRLQLALAEVDLHALIADAVDELALAFPGRALHHKKVGQGSRQMDGDRFVQMLGNLVANAMAYGAADQAVTVVSFVGADAHGVSIHNLGPAIPHEVLPTIFEPMTRGDVEAGAARSVGLGLFIVRQIAIAHGGQVMVTSSEDQGTTFTVSCQATGA